MSFLDKLKNLFETNFGDIFSNNNLTLFSITKNPSAPLEVRGDNRLLIDLSRLTAEERARVKQLLDSSIQEEDITFLTEKSTEKVEQIKRNLPRLGDEELLRFYKDKINIDLYRALEMSLMVRNAFRKGEEITELKRDIAYKYPEFGNNLCNLTTSNYFDTYFKELYEIMLQEPDFEIGKYQREVQRIAVSLPYMVFINHFKSYEEFSAQVKFKLEKLKKYGTGKLRLHALGRDNVLTSLKIAHEYKDNSVFSIEKEINPSGTLIVVLFKF